MERDAMPARPLQELSFGMSTVTCLMIVFLFLFYFYRTWYWHNFTKNGWIVWWREARPGVVILLFVAGSCLGSLGLYLGRYFYNRDREFDELESWTSLLVIAGMVIKVLGGCGIVHEFTPKFLGHLPWILTIIAVSTFAILTLSGIL